MYYDDGSSGRLPQPIPVVFKDLDDHCAHELFFDIQRVVETLQNGTALTTSEETVVLLPEQLSITVCTSGEEQYKFLQRIAELPPILGRYKRICHI